MERSQALDKLIALYAAEKAQAEKNPAKYWFIEAPRDPISGEKLWPCANAVQREFAMSPAKSKWIFGGNSSGKSYGVVADTCCDLSHCHPYHEVPKRPMKVRHYALNFGKVDEILLPYYRNGLAPGLVNVKRGRAGYHTDSHTFYVRCPYGADHEVQFATYDQDLSIAEGGQFDRLNYDEPPPEPIRRANLVRMLKKGGMSMETGALTPLGQELAWDISWIHNEIVNKADGKNIAVWWMSSDINRENLSAEAFDRLFGQMTEQEQAVRRHGRFAFLVGLVYRDPRFGPEHICKPFDVRERIRKMGHKAGQVYRGLDHGIGAPTAVSWWYVEGRSGEARGWKFQEFLAEGNNVATNCALIRDMDAGLPDGPWIGDASIWNKDPVTGRALAEEYHANGVPIIPGESSPGSVERGHEVIQQRMRIPRTTEGLSWREGGEVPTPRFMVFEDCIETIRAYQNYIRKPVGSRRTGETRGKVAPAERYKHLPDTDRYVWTFEPSGEREEAPPLPDCDPRTGVPRRIHVPTPWETATVTGDLALGVPVLE